MSAIPKVFDRVSKRNQHQLYQPGFNRRNGCWIDGNWITVYPDDWIMAAHGHAETYAEVHDQMAVQSHRNKPVAIKNLTKAQKLAWSYYSGDQDFNYVTPQGTYGIGRCKTQRDKEILPKDIEWIRNREWKIVRQTVDYNGKVHDILKVLLVPEDLLTPTTDPPVDVWRHIVKENRSNMDGMGRAAAKQALREDEDPRLRGLMAGMAITTLLEIEDEIIRDEWSFQQKGKPDRYTDRVESLQRYVALRGDLQESFGDQFQGWYDQIKETHNSCARHNHSWVLPKFNADGTHDPLTDENVPERER